MFAYSITSAAASAARGARAAQQHNLSAHFILQLSYGTFNLLPFALQNISTRQALLAVLKIGTKMPLK